MPRQKKALADASVEDASETPVTTERSAARSPKPPVTKPPAAKSPAARRLAPYRQSIAGTLLAAREAVMTPVRPILREAGVTEQQWRVLRVLVDEGPIDVSRLASSAMLWAPSVSRILRELTLRGLILRRTDEADRRKFIVEITKAGKALLDSTALHTLDVIARYADGFGSERLQTLLSELRAFTGMISTLYGEVDLSNDEG